MMFLVQRKIAQKKEKKKNCSYSIKIESSK